MQFLTWLFSGAVWSGIGSAILAFLQSILTLVGGGSALLLAGCLSICVMATGCQLFKPNTEPIERGMSQVMTEVVKPAVLKASDELSARTAQLQGQGSLINPGYKVTGHAGMFQGVMYDFTLTTVGVSANLSAAGQADAGQPSSVPPPVMRAPGEKPQ